MTENELKNILFNSHIETRIQIGNKVYDFSAPITKKDFLMREKSANDFIKFYKRLEKKYLKHIKTCDDEDCYFMCPESKILHLDWHLREENKSKYISPIISEPYEVDASEINRTPNKDIDLLNKETL